MKFFTNCHTLEDLKAEYKTLLFKYHPDLSEDPNATEICKDLNNEYKIMFEKLKNTHRNAQGEQYTTAEDNTETVEMYKDIINSIIHFEGIKIEIIGCFIWLSGDTKQYKDQLKALTFRWSSNKMMWYYSPPSYKKRSKKSYSIDDIKAMFDTSEIKSRPLKQVTA